MLAATATAAVYPPAIQHLAERGVHIVKQFKAPGNLTGYAARVGSERVMLYATPDGRHVLVGTLLDATGRNLTAQQFDRYLPKRPLWQRLAHAAWVAVGAAQPKRMIYVFTDPNCPYCHRFWRATQPYLSAGLQVRHILVGVVAPSSAAKAAAILEASNPAKALRRNERDYNAARLGGENAAGGIAPDPSPRPATRATLAANRRLMETLGFHGTPGIVYRDAQGRVLRYAGLPPLGQLPHLLRLPPQPRINPRLKPDE
jgi:thiol:disulfide interchange protein DsbG